MKISHSKKRADISERNKLEATLARNYGWHECRATRVAKNGFVDFRFYHFSCFPQVLLKGPDPWPNILEWRQNTKRITIEKYQPKKVKSKKR